MTMSTDTSQAPANSPSATELISGILGDLQELGIQHLAMFRTEIQQELRKTSDAVATLAIGFAVLQIGAFLIAFMFVQLLIAMAPQLSAWVCYGIVGALFVIIGATSIALGIQKSRKIQAISSPTAEVIKDDSKWLTNSN